MHNETQIISYEYNECLIKGACSINPTLSSIQEVILLYLKQLAFYLLKLKDFGITNEPVKEIILTSLFNIVSNVEYNQEQFHKLISKLDNSIIESKALYENFCQNKGIDIESVKTYFKRAKNFNLTSAIKKGEKYFLKKIQALSQKQKDLFDIALFLTKSISIKMIELQRLNKDYNEGYYSILSLLNVMNPSKFKEDEILQEINKSIESYYTLLKKVFKTQTTLYGEPSESEISFSTDPGKAILVSGFDYNKLKLILEAVKNTNIQIYTHGMEMLMAHSFPVFRAYKNLKGHFGLGMETSMIDFATFPGAVLMTKGCLQKFEYLYRGRLFTLDPIPSIGVVKIKDNNYEPLIKSALEAKGFTKCTKKPSLHVGVNFSKIKKQLNGIIDKIIKKEIKNIYIIGLLNFQSINGHYFDKFFEYLNKDSFVFSLSHKKNAENIFHLDSLYDYSLIYRLLNEINSKIPLNELNIIVFLTSCDKHTISNLLYLKHLGIKKIYMCKCPPYLINPTLITTLQSIFGIKEFSDPKKDFEETLI
jgi:hydroxylamine reductase